MAGNTSTRWIKGAASIVGAAAVTGAAFWLWRRWDFPAHEQAAQPSDAPEHPHTSRQEGTASSRGDTSSE